METACNVVKNFKPMMEMMTETADMMKTATRPHFGLTLPGHKTEREHYAPLGVLHAASGRKLWRFWPPAWKPKMNANVVFISNRDDMVWIPPGWDHESITLEGQAHGEDDAVLCVHWMTWCLPWSQCAEASRDLMLGKTGGRTEIKGELRESVSSMVTEHHDKANKKVGKKVFFGIGGESEDDE